MTNIAYIGRDNDIRIRLCENGIPISTTTITGIDAIIGETTVASTNETNDPIRWSRTGYSTGEVRLFLGEQDIDVGSYIATLVVYDSDHKNGLVWDSIMVQFIEDPYPVEP